MVKDKKLIYVILIILGILLLTQGGKKEAELGDNYADLIPSCGTGDGYGIWENSVVTGDCPWRYCVDNDGHPGVCINVNPGCWDPNRNGNVKKIYDCNGGQLIEEGDSSGCDLFNQVGTYYSCESILGGLCSADDLYYCSGGNVYRTLTTSSSDVYTYWCEVGDSFQSASIMPCPNGCSNGECVTQICFPDAQWCDTSNNVVKGCSSDGKSTTTLEECTSDETCIEETAKNAICMPDTLYYCYSQGRCYFSSVKGSDCWDTKEECENNVIWCLSSDNSACTKRLTSCNTGETKYSDLINCEAEIGPISPTPEIKYVEGIKKSQLKTLSSSSIANHVCGSPKNLDRLIEGVLECQDGSECVSLMVLEEEGTITSDKGDRILSHSQNILIDIFEWLTWQKLFDANEKESIGVCIIDDGGDFCVEFANDMVSKFYEKGDCQTNTMIFFIVLFLIIMLVTYLTK